MSDGKINSFPLGPLDLITPHPSTVACVVCHRVYVGDVLLTVKVDRYQGPEPISGWITCKECR